VSKSKDLSSEPGLGEVTTGLGRRRGRSGITASFLLRDEEKRILARIKARSGEGGKVAGVVIWREAISAFRTGLGVCRREKGWKNGKQGILPNSIPYLVQNRRWQEDYKKRSP